MNPTEMTNEVLILAFTQSAVKVWDKSLQQIEKSPRLIAVYDEYKRLRVEMLQRMTGGVHV